MLYWTPTLVERIQHSPYIGVIFNFHSRPKKAAVSHPETAKHHTEAAHTDHAQDARMPGRLLGNRPLAAVRCHGVL